VKIVQHGPVQLGIGHVSQSRSSESPNR
jgi:hypothetical protein